MVVLDDIHLALKKSDGDDFLEDLAHLPILLILVSSQQPPSKEPTLFKGLKSKETLTELPKEEAIKQLENALN